MFAVTTAHAESAFLTTQTLSGSIPIKSWKTLRDARVVKQDLDNSCSAASLATLLNEYYGQELTEEALFEMIDKAELFADFDHMQEALPYFDFKAEGYATTYDQLTKLNMPVIVFLIYRKSGHFSVLRGINKKTVWIADPSLGNLTLSKAQFLEMWETRKDRQENDHLKGKILVVLPAKAGIASSKNFFTKSPKRQTAQAVKQLVIRNTK